MKAFSGRRWPFSNTPPAGHFFFLWPPTVPPTRANPVVCCSFYGDARVFFRRRPPFLCVLRSLAMLQRFFCFPWFSYGFGRPEVSVQELEVVPYFRPSVCLCSVRKPRVLRRPPSLIELRPRVPLQQLNHRRGDCKRFVHFPSPREHFVFGSLSPYSARAPDLARFPPLRRVRQTRCLAAGCCSSFIPFRFFSDFPLSSHTFFVPAFPGFETPDEPLHVSHPFLLRLFFLAFFSPLSRFLFGIILPFSS